MRQGWLSRTGRRFPSLSRFSQKNKIIFWIFYIEKNNDNFVQGLFSVIHFVWSSTACKCGRKQERLLNYLLTKPYIFPIVIRERGAHPTAHWTIDLYPLYLKLTSLTARDQFYHFLDIFPSNPWMLTFLKLPLYFYQDQEKYILHFFCRSRNSHRIHGKVSVSNITNAFAPFFSPPQQ